MVVTVSGGQANCCKHIIFQHGHPHRALHNGGLRGEQVGKFIETCEFDLGSSSLPKRPPAGRTMVAQLFRLTSTFAFELKKIVGKKACVAAPLCLPKKNARLTADLAPKVPPAAVV